MNNIVLCECDTTLFDLFRFRGKVGLEINAYVKDGCGGVCLCVCEQ